MHTIPVGSKETVRWDFSKEQSIDYHHSSSWISPGGSSLRHVRGRTETGDLFHWHSGEQLGPLYEISGSNPHLSGPTRLRNHKMSHMMECSWTQAIRTLNLLDESKHFVLALVSSLRRLVLYPTPMVFLSTCDNSRLKIALFRYWYLSQR